MPEKPLSCSVTRDLGSGAEIRPFDQRVPSRAFVTISAGNYMKYVSRWARSLREAGHQEEIFCLLLDGDNAIFDSDLRVNVLTLDEFGFGKILDSMKQIYNLIEFATAIKPLVIRKLLKDFDEVTFMDPDTRAFQAIPLTEWSNGYVIELTPHRISPCPRDGKLPYDDAYLRTGIYNLGYISVRQGSEEFLDWWWERLILGSRSDTFYGLFTDQKWMDLAPIYFPTQINYSTGMNVAIWNFDERCIHESAQRPNSEQLIFAHFSGFRLGSADNKSRNLRVFGNSEAAKAFRSLADKYLTEVEIESTDYEPNHVVFQSRTWVSKLRQRKVMSAGPNALGLSSFTSHELRSSSWSAITFAATIHIRSVVKAFLTSSR